jgi:glycerol kinase
MQTETTALGAAYLAGLQCGVYDSFEDLEDNWVEEATFSPSMDQDLRLELIHGWDKAIRRVRSDYQ